MADFEPQALLELLEAYPRFKDQALDPLRASAESGAGAGALLIRGPSRLLHTLTKVVGASQAPTTAERFKPLLSRSRWVAASALADELSGATGLKGLNDRLAKLGDARGDEFVAVVAVEGDDGALRCTHATCCGSTKVADSGPWLYVLEHGLDRTDRRPAFKYTGALRPYRVGPDRPVPASVPKPDYYETGEPEAERNAPCRNTPAVLNAAQIAGVRRACVLGRQILDAAHRAVKPGVTTDEIDRVVHDFTVEHGAYPAPLHYINFPKSVCTSVNEVVCHGIPDMRELQSGDIVNVDVSAILDGYHADLNETFCVGEVDRETKRLIKATHDSLWKAIEMCRPGVFFRDVGGVISKHVNGQGFQVDKTYCGHGIGEFFHSAPNIPHYAGNKAKFTMKPGHCFTIEPMVNMGGWKDTHWLDGWTAVTKDGKPSAQFEHQLLMGENGVEVLTARTPDSPPLWWEVPGALNKDGTPS